MRSTPITSILIVDKKDKRPISMGQYGRTTVVFVGPTEIAGAQTYRMDRGRMKFYFDESGAYSVPQEWIESGVTVEALQHDQSGTVYYDFRTGKAEAN